LSKIEREKLPEEYRNIYDRLIMKVDTDISFDKVILSEENKEKYNAFIAENNSRDRLRNYGLEPMNRLLLYGASGTGKTYSLKALSNLIGYTMLYVDIAQSLTDGNVANNIKDIFKLANYIGECMIFFDECDSIAWNRDAVDNEGGVVRRATNSLFQSLDQMNHTCIFVAATNVLHRIDPAFERRFNLKLQFLKPSMDIDVCIKRFLYPKFLLIDNVSPSAKEIIKRRSAQNAKLSYYEIEEIVKRAMKRAVINETNKVYTEDIYKDFALSMNFKMEFETKEDRL
jgi:AAA+ superfamily predicted ATPase